MANSSSTPPKVFISYSHDSLEHKDRVLSLADYLVQKGIDCNLDQYEQFPVQGWQNWMLDQLEWADFVLIVCTETYHRRFRGQEKPGKGKGGTWEGGIISQELYDTQGNNKKFIPVIFNAADGKYIPTIVCRYNHYKIDSAKGWERLYRYLTNQHDTPKPVLGEIEKLPKRDRKGSFLELDNPQISSNQNNLKSDTNDRGKDSNAETNNKLNLYLKSISQNLVNQGCLFPETNVNYENKQFELVGEITNFELSVGVLNMRGDAFFIFSYFDTINIKILRRYASLCLEYTTEKSTSSGVGQIINARVPSNICFAIAVVDNLAEDTKNSIQTENPFDIDTDTLWYKVPVVYSLKEQQLYYYDCPDSFWSNFKGEIVWKKLREIIKNILNP